MSNYIRLEHVSKRFGQTEALHDLTVDLPSGAVISVIAPDASGKTTLMRLLAGLLEPSSGKIEIFGEPARKNGGSQTFVGYMPQRFGLYEDLSVLDNLHLHAELRCIPASDRAGLFNRLLKFTSLTPFTTRLAGRLSGGMKQKLGLACALLGQPRLLLLDEPGVGVDPGSRRELWNMVQNLVGDGMTVVWTTAYMEEAERCPWTLMLAKGKIIYAGAPAEIIHSMQDRVFMELPPIHQKSFWLRQALVRWTEDARTLDAVAQGSKVRIVFKDQADTGKNLVPAQPHLEDVYMDAVGGIQKQTSAYASFPCVPNWDSTQQAAKTGAAVVEANSLSKMFGTFTAVNQISFSVLPGQIFGLLGPNGAGKSTLFRMLCGLLKPTAGSCRVAGVDMLKAPGQARSKLGYMAQKFSLYGDLTPSQNINLFSRLYGVSHDILLQRRELLIPMLQLDTVLHQPCEQMSLGQKQRLALLCATIHAPQVLFLDEPTSGVDPQTRREFWKHIHALTQNGVAVIVTTHFMEEAEYCDNIALIYHGSMIANGLPETLKSTFRTEKQPDPTLEDAFIAAISQYTAEHGE